LFGGRDLHPAPARQAAIARLRHFVGRIARGFIRAAPPAARRPVGARRHGVDRRGLTDACRAEKETSRIQAKNRRPIDKAFIHSIFDRDHPGTPEEKVIDAFADAVTALDSSVPTGTYVDMCSKLPVVDPEKIAAPTLVMRGQWDGIASLEDLLAFYARLPNPDKHFAVMPGISHASFQQKNYALVYHILWSFFTQPAPIYRG
jgi:pimeloyl-ACP methyl ester carboxylesterase